MAKKKTLSEQKREAILEAAKNAFQADGVNATSMDKLAELAQVSKRTLYNHFANKEELVSVLISDLWLKAMVEIDLPYQPDQSLDRQLLDQLMHEIDLVGGEEYLNLTRMALGHFFYQPEVLFKEIEKLNAQETSLKRWVKAAVDDGKLKKLDVDFAIGQLHNLIKGSCFWPQVLKFQQPLSEEQKLQLAEETVKLFLCRYSK